MDGNHVDGEAMKEKDHMKSIFSVFTNLFSEKGRDGKEFISLIKVLDDGDFSIGSSSNLQYAVKRLVRGISSTHLCAQCASFAALTCFLKYEYTTAEDVLAILDSELKGNFSKSEQGALRSGCVLTCGAIIQSEIFGNLPAKTKEKTLDILMSTGRTKNYLSSTSYKFLIDVVSSVDENDFKNVIWPMCKKEIKLCLADGSVHSYDFLLHCHNKFPHVVDKFIIKLESSYQLFLEKIVNLLLSSHVAHDEPVYERVCAAMVKEKKILLNIWAASVENASNSKNSFKNKTVLTLFYWVLKCLNEEKLVPKLLVPKFIELIIMILSFRKTKKSDNTECHALAKASLDLLVSCLVKDGVPSSIRFKTIEKLMFYPANMKFEKKTGTKCIQSLVMHLDETSLKQLAKIHCDIVSGDLKKVVDEDDNSEDWNNNEKQYALHLFVKFLHHPTVKNEKEWKLEQIKFLFDSGFIKGGKLHSSVQKCARDCFYRAIEIQMQNFEHIVELLDDLVDHVNHKIENNNVDLPNNAAQCWKKVFTTVQKLRTSKDKLFIAIHLLIIHMGMQLFSDSNLAIHNIDELLMCYSRLKKNKGDEDLHWSEVTVDLMLSLLSRENKLWRYVVCNLVFPQMVKHITPTALHQIIEVINPESSDKVLGGEQSEESEDEEDDNEETEEDDKDAEEEEKEEKSESSLTESENDENVTINDQLRMAVKDALGMSAALTDQESVDMDEMDEEEERKLNERLAAAFKMFKSNTGRQRKKQTKREKALTHFRFRVLDLVEIYIMNGPSISGCLDLLFPLFNLLELSIKDTNQRVFYHRVDSILKKLSALKKFSDTADVNEKLIQDHFDVLLSRKEVPSMIFVEMAGRISDCCTFLVRCSQLIKNPSGTPLVENYRTLLDNFFHSRDNKLPISLFQSVLRSAWPGSWKLIPALFELIVDPTIKLFKKMKAIELLEIFYKNGRLHASGDKKSHNELNEMENKFIVKFIKYQTEYMNKKEKMNEKMFLSFFTKILSLVAVANQSFKKHRSDSKKPPQWKNLISKMTELDIVLANKKSRKQLTNLANLFSVEMKTAQKIASPNEKEEETEIADETEEERQEIEKTPRKKKKGKSLSAEKVKMKKESIRLREEMGNDGIDMIPFSSLDVYTIPENDDDEDKDNEPPLPKKKKSEGINSNGILSPQ